GGGEILKDESPFPPQAGDARVGGEAAAIEANAKIGKFADRLNAGWAEPDAPCPPLDRPALRKGAAGEKSDIGSVLGIADRFIADGFNAGVASGLGQILAGRILRRTGPARAIGIEWRVGGVDRRFAADRG